MVVGVNVQQHKPATARNAFIQEFSHGCIEGIVFGKRAGDLHDRERGAPQIETPRVFRRAVDGAGAGSVRVDLEARTVHHDSSRGALGPLSSERILLAKPLGIGERAECKHPGPQLMPGVQRRRDHRPFAVRECRELLHVRPLL